MRNPSRRSRNIGTAKQGHGQNNRLSIPTFWSHPDCPIFVENLRDYRTETREIESKTLTFVTERPRLSCAHACSIDDILRVLRCVPPLDLEGLELIILRQPKRKEEILSPVWGRYYPFLEIKKLSGSAIILETLDLSQPLRWEKSLQRYGFERLERLRLQGHKIVETPRYYEIFSTLQAVRETQLTETLPHEVGHHVQYQQDENIDQRTRLEKENFAEKYARDFIEKFGSKLR